MANKKTIPDEEPKKNSGKSGSDTVKSTKNSTKSSSSKKDEMTLDEMIDSKRASSEKRKQVHDEVILIITGLIGILIYLSFMDMCGIIGKGIKNLLFGLLGGFLPYLFPIALFSLVFYVLRNPDDPLAIRKTTIFLLSQFVLAAIIHLFSNVASEEKFFRSFVIGYEERRGGGLFGACLAKPLYLLFGKVASVIILIALLLVCIIMIIGRAVFRDIIEYYKERKRLREEAANALYDDNSPYAIQPQETSSQIFTIEDIQEQNRKKRVTMVDAAPPEGPVDLSFYGEAPAPRAEAPKQSFVDKLLGRNKTVVQPAPTPTYTAIFVDGEQVNATQSNVPGTAAQAFRPGDPGTDPRISHDGHPFYQIELDQKFRETNGTVDNSILKTDYAERRDSGLPVSEREAARRAAVDRKLSETDGVSAATAVPARRDAVSHDIPISGLTDNDHAAYEDGVNPYDAVETSAAVAPTQEELQAGGIRKQQTSDGAEGTTAKAGSQAGKESGSETQAAADIEPVVPVVKPPKVYRFPPIDLLKRPSGKSEGMTPELLKATAAKLQQTLQSFGVNVTVTNISCGPSVTRYELTPEQGVKVSRITNLENDIKLNLAAADIRIEAPIPGKSAVGIEVPNAEASGVLLRTLIESKEFKTNDGKISFAVGKDIGGRIVISDIAKMPHLLIAGATGSGKSVCINTMIISLLYKYKPEDLRIIMIDPKVVELSVYNGIPHLLIPVVTDPRKASNALNWAVQEMTHRYDLFAQLGVRNLEGYNEKLQSSSEPLQDNDGNTLRKMPQIVIIVDELADLMMVAPGEVEDAICRLAQLARAAGIHLVIATQRPSVDVITGLIKANIPSRIAFAVSSGIDSRTILDQIGAEKLLGKGDMLFFPQGIPKPVRLQGPFVSDEEIQNIVNYMTEKNGAEYDESAAENIKNGVSTVADQMKAASADAAPDDGRDEYFAQAGRFIIEKDKASIGMLQRVYKIGFNRAARIMDQLSEAGVVGPEEGTKPRKILMTADQFETFLKS
ncbi:MAG: DNA translocase FtsK 4TM domain-containing protein [Lachnospiraceae bacterium]|nr:DNA translocase FtsK 4TM domain-containing protein [Lachnospiraceae bacterium]